MTFQIYVGEIIKGIMGMTTDTEVAEVISYL
jgi:hypothetical protein